MNAKLHEPGPERQMNWLTVRWRGLLLLIGFIAVVLMTFVGGETTFAVSSQVGAVELTVADAGELVWRIPFARFSGPRRRARRRAEYVRFAAGDRMMVTRQGTGIVQLGLQASSPGKASGTLFDAGFTAIGPLGESEEISVGRATPSAQDLRSVSFLLGGAVSSLRVLGPTTVDAAVTPTRGGRVSVLRQSLFHGSAFEVLAVDLLPGDEIQLQEIVSPIVGFITVDERPGLGLVYRAVAGHANVVRIGGGGSEIKATMFDVLREDPVIQKLWAAYVLLSSLLLTTAPSRDLERKR